eukprot:CFRG6231T1
MKLGGKTVIVVGAGPVGLCTALAIKKTQKVNKNDSNVRILVYERLLRDDFLQCEAGRNVNVTICERGLRTLRFLDVVEDVLRKSSPLVGVAVHRANDRGVTVIPYNIHANTTSSNTNINTNLDMDMDSQRDTDEDTRKGETHDIFNTSHIQTPDTTCSRPANLNFIHSISRKVLVEILLTRVHERGIEVVYGHTLRDVKLPLSETLGSLSVEFSKTEFSSENRASSNQTNEYSSKNSEFIKDDTITTLSGIDLLVGADGVRSSVRESVFNTEVMGVGRGDVCARKNADKSLNAFDCESGGKHASANESTPSLTYTKSSHALKSSVKASLGECENAQGSIDDKECEITDKMSVNANAVLYTHAIGYRELMFKCKSNAQRCTNTHTAIHAQYNNKTSGLSRSHLHVWCDRGKMLLLLLPTQSDDLHIGIYAPLSYLNGVTANKLRHDVYNRAQDIWQLSIKPTNATNACLKSKCGTLHTVVCSRLAVRNIVLVGDSAHCMPPFLGQGLNSGLEDAYILAMSLTHANGLSISQVLTNYSSERLGDIRVILRKCHDLIDSYSHEELWAGSSMGTDGRKGMQDGILGSNVDNCRTDAANDTAELSSHKQTWVDKSADNYTRFTVNGRDQTEIKEALSASDKIEMYNRNSFFHRITFTCTSYRNAMLDSSNDREVGVHGVGAERTNVCVKSDVGADKRGGTDCVGVGESNNIDRFRTGTSVILSQNKLWREFINTTQGVHNRKFTGPAVGDRVNFGQVLARAELVKTTLRVVADKTGIITHIDRGSLSRAYGGLPRFHITEDLCNNLSSNRCKDTRVIPSQKSLFDKTMFKSKLRTKWLGQRLVCKSETGSTMEDAKEACISEKDIHGFVCVADKMTNGRGRQGKAWRATGVGNLYTTFVIVSRCKPQRKERQSTNSPQAQPLNRSCLKPSNTTADTVCALQFAAAVAVVCVLKKMGVDASIKWPNDVWVSGKKICGILVEADCHVSGTPHITDSAEQKSTYTDIDNDINTCTSANTHEDVSIVFSVGIGVNLIEGMAYNGDSESDNVATSLGYLLALRGPTLNNNGEDLLKPSIRREIVLALICNELEQLAGLSLAEIILKHFSQYDLLMGRSVQITLKDGSSYIGKANGVDSESGSLVVCVGDENDIGIATITPDDVRLGEWVKDAAAIFVGGGADMGYLQELAHDVCSCVCVNEFLPKGSIRINDINEKRTLACNSRHVSLPDGISVIREYIQAGGVYVGICAGAYMACNRVIFDEGGALEVIGDRPLSFFPGNGVGPVVGDYDYASERGARAVRIRWASSENRMNSIDMSKLNNGEGVKNKTTEVEQGMAHQNLCETRRSMKSVTPSVPTGLSNSSYVYVNGGGMFSAGFTKDAFVNRHQDGGDKSTYEVLSVYDSDNVIEAHNFAPAVIMCNSVGKTSQHPGGKALLMGPHLEWHPYYLDDKDEYLRNPNCLPRLRASAHQNDMLFQMLLRERCGLRV